jgi:hypothetical protein
VSSVWGVAETQAGGLLRVLFVWIGALSPNPAGAKPFIVNQRRQLTPSIGTMAERGYGMSDSALFTVGKIPAHYADGSPALHADGSHVLIDGPDRWEQLRALPFDPAFVEQMALLNHYERLPLIVTWYSRAELEPDELNRLLADNWDHGGYAANIGLEEWDWVELFETAGFITDTPGYVRPTAPLAIYRGTRLGGERGWSWSTDRDVAAWFARRSHDFGTPAVLLSATIAPEYVLGAFNGRDEAEVLIDLDGLEWSEVQIIDAASEEVRAGFDRRNVTSAARLEAFRGEATSDEQ